jgi:hypothetical protein
MACEPSNATVVIDKLESQRLIERRPHPPTVAPSSKTCSRTCCSEPSPAAETSSAAASLVTSVPVPIAIPDVSLLHGRRVVDAIPGSATIWL